MDWKARVELFEQLRQEHEFGVGTIAGVAAKFGVHRRMVRQAIAGALPPPHRYPRGSNPSWMGSRRSLTRCWTRIGGRRASSVTRHGASTVAS